MFVTKSKNIVIDLGTIKSIQRGNDLTYEIRFIDKSNPIYVSSEDGQEIVEKFAQFAQK